MTANDVLRRLGFALKLSDPAMLEMLQLADRPLDRDSLVAFFAKEEEPGYRPCPDAVLEALLDGMIIKYRGRRDEGPGGAEQQSQAGSGRTDPRGASPGRTGSRGAGPGQTGPEQRHPATLDNNMILKKLRIALELKEDELLGIMKLAGVDLSAHELSALFRKKDHKNYKPCMDQFLRNFLAGLARFNTRRSADGKPSLR